MATLDSATAAAFIHSRLDDIGLTPVQFRVYAHFVRRAGGVGGTFFESVPNCAAFCQIKASTLRAAMKRLITLGLIQTVATPSGRTWTYRVTPMEEWKPEPLPNGNPSPQKGVVGNATPPPQTAGVDITPPKAGTGSGSLKREDTPPKAGPTKVIPEGNPMKGDGPPTFLPITASLYRREYESMLKDAQGVIQKVKTDPGSYAKDLTKDADDLVEFLQTQKPENWEQRIKTIMEAPSSYERKNLKPKAAAIVQAWKDRIEEIRRAMAGIQK